MKTSRIEVMQHLGQQIEGEIDEFLKDIDTNWQPADFLPASNNPDFSREIKDLQEQCRELPYDYMAVLVGDIITEEALPTYESWLIDIEGISKAEPQGWSKWIRKWTAEENRHGDLLNKYIYLSGRVNMKQMEITTQHLIADGMEIGTARDPYRNFVYTSFRSWPPISPTGARPPLRSNMIISNCRKSAVLLQQMKCVMPGLTKVLWPKFLLWTPVK